MRSTRDVEVTLPKTSSDYLGLENIGNNELIIIRADENAVVKCLWNIE